MLFLVDCLYFFVGYFGWVVGVGLWFVFDVVMLKNLLIVYFVMMIGVFVGVGCLCLFYCFLFF